MGAYMIKKIIVLLLGISLLASMMGCTEKEVELIDRESKIPTNAVKVTPETDLNPQNLIL